MDSGASNIELLDLLFPLGGRNLLIILAVEMYFQIVRIPHAIWNQFQIRKISIEDVRKFES